MSKYATNSRLHCFEHFEDEPEEVGEERKTVQTTEKDHPYDKAGILSLICNILHGFYMLYFEANCILIHLLKSMIIE